MFGVWGMAVLANDPALILEPQQILKEQIGADFGTVDLGLVASG